MFKSFVAIDEYISTTYINDKTIDGLPLAYYSLKFVTKGIRK